MVKRAASVFSVDVVGLEADAGRPTYERICERIRAAILSGALPLNARLPSSRVLARDFGVARTTVDCALGHLVADGYIVRRRGAGSFVASLLPERDQHPRGLPAVHTPAKSGPKPRLSRRAQALRRSPGHYRPESVIPFTPSLPPSEFFPRKTWNRLLTREASRPGARYWMSGPTNGLPALREAIAAHASAMRAVRCSPDQVVVVTSAQQATELAAKVLADVGDRIWIEAPGYQPVEQCLIGAGLEPVPVSVDEEGLSVEAGRKVAPEARLAYVTPSHQYPLGCEMSIERRKALLEWAVGSDAYVIEDDYDGDYRYEGRPIASLQGMDPHGRVLYVGSFNRILFPALRIAYAIVPEPLVGPFVDAKHVTDGHTALLMQGVLAAFIQEGYLAEHLRKTRVIFDERRRAFLEAAGSLSDWLELGPARAGLHVAALFRDQRIDDQAVAAQCARAGVDVKPLSTFGVPNKKGLIFGFAAAAIPAIKPALEIVRKAAMEQAAKVA
jgi:GntR family transcriptional regulator/MocR family aminotransferase